MLAIIRALFISTIFTTTVNAQTPSIAFTSTEQRTALLELYTSEGCSSCPPAEAWLTRVKSNPGLWRDFVPVAFHVDYWNRLGWRDPWSAKQFSDRQSAYATARRSENVYTPEFLLNGKEWRAWSGFQAVPKSAAANVGRLSVQSNDTNHWRVVFQPAVGDSGAYEIHAAALAGNEAIEVKAGENRGRRLVHDFAVTALVQAPLARREGALRGEFELTLSATKTAQADAAIGVWVTKAKDLEPIQATGAWLWRAKTDHQKP